ncbi:AraC family transcriptional regulator [Streptomyces shenzhenensis]|uniref:AraC family transcriptional regulator n=1 Tax=Streptomyces shenzhenensis TaxID=943815 RepID=UPI003409B347
MTSDETRELSYILTEHFGRKLTGLATRIDLTGVSQRWLRDLIWDHLVAVLRSPSCPRSGGTFDDMRRSGLELSTFLELRAPAGGHDPRTFDGRTPAQVRRRPAATRAGRPRLAGRQRRPPHLLTPLRSRSADVGKLSPRQMQTISAYMRAYLAERISLDDLAREVALSRFHFLRLFSATTGQTPHQFLTGLRIDAARRLLAAGDESVGRIGHLCGFSTASHFVATFRRLVGHTPTAYRRLQREGRG